MTAIRYVSLMCLTLALPSLVLAGSSSDGPAINYISADAVYVNVGSGAGLEIGAHVKVVRGGKEIAVLTVVHVSSHSASCRVVSQTDAPRVGDAVFFEIQQPVEKAPPPEPATPVEKPRVDRRGSDRVRGSLALQNVWQRDLSGSELSSYQPSVATRLTVDDVFGTGGTLRVRHRTRLYHRSQPLSTEQDTNEWTHRLSEFGVYFGDPRESSAFGLGRVLNPYIRGLGYMDGAYASIKIRPHISVGVAGGMDPSIEDSSAQPDRQKYGAFVAYERGSLATRRLATTLAFSGSYNDGTINREFGYIQNTLSLARRLSVYHSVEVDVNRGWRKSAEGNRLTFSNTFLTANLAVTSAISVDASYDARRNIRDFHTIDSPDSLFDDVLSTGYGGGVSISLPRHVRIRARGGVRYREDNQSNRHGSVSIHAGRLPIRGHSMSARLSVSETPYVTGYRPTFTYRFPIKRRTRIAASLGGYIYEQGSVTTRSTFGQLDVHHTLGRRYYVAGNLRRIAGDSLDSVQLFTEVGLSF